jgi:hypothetical protein
MQVGAPGAERRHIQKPFGVAPTVPGTAEEY